MGLSKILRRFWPKAFRRNTAQLQTSASTSRMAMETKPGQALLKLRELGYAFNADGELRKVDKATGEAGDEPFQFDIHNGDQAKNQKNYENLGELITEVVYDLLEQEGLSRTYIPKDVPQEQATFIFTHPEQLKNSKKLLVLIHGSGVVRAGQWARRLIINNSIDHGTQIPYIKRALSKGYGVLVTNTNDNYRVIDGSRKPIVGLNSAISHAAYVWKNVVMASEPESVAIVAHSYGGAVTFDLAKRFPEFFENKVFAIALTDSAHSFVSSDVEKTVGSRTCNWVSSNEPLDKPMKTQKGGIKIVSAGHPQHEWSSYAAFESVFNFLEDKYSDFTDKIEAKRAKLEE